MPGRANDFIEVPHSLWRRPETTAALRDRDMGRLFALLRQYAGASQTQIAIACGMTQGKVSDIMRGTRLVQTLALFERIADGLGMPDDARMALGIAPRGSSRSTALRPSIAARDTGQALEITGASGLFSLDSLSPEDEQEEQDPVRRRTFVGLTGASLFSTLLGGTPNAEHTVGAESLAGALLDPGTGSTAVSQVPGISALTSAVNRARKHYQDCRYSTLIKYLPDLPTRLHAACGVFDGQDRLAAYALAADAEHVASWPAAQAR